MQLPVENIKMDAGSTVTLVLRDQLDTVEWIWFEYEVLSALQEVFHSKVAVGKDEAKGGWSSLTKTGSDSKGTTQYGFPGSKNHFAFYVQNVVSLSLDLRYVIKRAVDRV